MQKHSKIKSSMVPNSEMFSSTVCFFFPPLFAVALRRIGLEVQLLFCLFGASYSSAWEAASRHGGSERAE